MGFLDFFRSQRPAPQEGRALKGASGRGHTQGFLDFEEFNTDLTHPYGHDVYDIMYRTDGDVRQVVSLVSNPIIGGTWDVIPYGGKEADEQARNIAAFVRWALWDFMRPALPMHLSTALPVLVRSGFAPFEAAWASTDYEGKTVVVPRTLALRLPRTIVQFEQDRFGELTRIKQLLPTPVSSLVAREGAAPPNPGNNPSEIWLDRRNLVYYRIGAEGDNWEGVSLLRPAYKHWVYKDTIEKIDAIAQEREAVGVPICYPPLGATDDQLDAMEDVLEAMRTNEQAFIIAPGPKAGQGAEDGTGWLVEVLGYDRTGSGRDPQPSLKYHTDKIAAAFISEFMRLGHGQTGARATAQVQADPFQMSVEALTGLIEQTLNDEIVAPLVAYNYADAENPPLLKMSLVDSTSLSQLADFVLKLTQVGALLPDQELEDFLRDRADLPPARPESVAKRKAQDDKLRREVLVGTGNPGGGDKPGGNAKVGKHGNKSAPASSQSGGGAASLRHREDDDDESVVTLAYSDHFGRDYHRELTDWELNVDLDMLEDEMDAAPQQMEHACQAHILGRAPSEDLADAIHAQLLEHYESGAEHVRREIGRQNDPMLDRGAHDRGIKALQQRAEVGARHIIAAMDLARSNSDLIHGDHNPAHAAAAAERAGRAAARQVGRSHGVGALLQGRHDVALDAGDGIIGARYTSVLDRNTCRHCREADDGVVRDLTDPIRLDRRPPNRHCESTASGFNWCRCFEVYEPMPSGTALDANLVPNDPARTNWVEKAGGLPKFIADIAGDLISERGMETSRAIRVAIARVRLWANGGGRVSAATQAKAAEALAEWERMKARA